MKKTNLFKTALLGLTLGVISSCGGTTPSTNLGQDTNGDGVVSGNEVSAKKVQTLQAVTSINLLNSLSDVSPVLMQNKLMARRDATASTEDIEKILPQLDVLLTNDALVTSTLEDVETTIGEETFEKKETITFKDSSLKDVTYTLVYNSRVHEERDDDEIEKITIMSGVVLIDETTTYKFVSHMEEENEDDENEKERNFKVQVDERSYVLVEESYEKEGRETESEFEYTFVNNGRKELEYSIEIENEKFENDIEFEINDREYEVEKFTDKDGKELYKVKIKEDDNFKELFIYEKVVDEAGNVSFIRK